MSIKFIANDAYRDSALVLTLPAADTAGVLNSVKGPRYLDKTLVGTQPFSFIYRNENAGLNADHLIVTRADRFNGEPIDVNAYSNYSGSSSSLFSDATFGETLVGLNSQDWVLPFSAVSNQEALELKTTSSNISKWGKIYFGTGVELTGLEEVEITPHDENVLLEFNKQFWHVDARCALTFIGVTDSEIQSFHNLYNLEKDALFIYDSEGEHLPGKLWHVIIPELPTIRAFDDYSVMQLGVLRLKEWSSYD